MNIKRSPIMTNVMHISRLLDVSTLYFVTVQYVRRQKFEVKKVINGSLKFIPLASVMDKLAGPGLAWTIEFRLQDGSRLPTGRAGPGRAETIQTRSRV